MQYNILTIPSHVARRKYVTSHLASKGITNILIYEGEETKRRFDGLFKNIQNVVKNNYKKDFVILMEDDVFLTDEFSENKFRKLIDRAQQLGADILTGGIKEYVSIKEIPVEDTMLYEIGNYRGSQLMVIFKKYYDKILSYNPNKYEFEVWTSYQADLTKLVTIPFLAYQEDFPSRFLAKDKHKQDYVNCETQLITLLKK